MTRDRHTLRTSLRCLAFWGAVIHGGLGCSDQVAGEIPSDAAAATIDAPETNVTSSNDAALDAARPDTQSTPDSSSEASDATTAPEASTPAFNAYLAAYFIEKKYPDGTEDSRLYYAIARQGFQFAYAVNKGQPILASTMDDKLIRDPMVMRDPDGKSFHLVATVSWTHRPFTIWDSQDLIHWENERLVDVAPPGATLTWAPELLWDPDTAQYVAYWTGAVDNNWDTASIRYATSKDLKTFSQSQILMKESKGCLDADIIFARGQWYMVYRYTGIWTRTAKTALGPYENPVQILDLDVEGPAFFPVNHRDDQWGLVFDYFGGNQGRWGIALSTDMANWPLATMSASPYYTPEIFFPPGVRHGNVLPITDSEADAILAAYGATEYDYTGMAK